MSLIGNRGEYLAVCAEQAVEIDDYNNATSPAIPAVIRPRLPPDW
ncbi:hypothetical protein [Glycomyces tarimensis]